MSPAHSIPAGDRWTLDSTTAVSASPGHVNVVANATLTPQGARDLARRLLEAADTADGAARRLSTPAGPDAGDPGEPRPTSRSRRPS